MNCYRPIFIRCSHEVLTSETNPFSSRENINIPVNLNYIVSIEKISREFDSSPAVGVKKYKTAYGIRFYDTRTEDSYTDWWYPLNLQIERDSDYEAILKAFEFKY